MSAVVNHSVGSHPEGDTPGTACRIVVTGIGMVTPLGPDRKTSWRGLLEGRRAVRRLRAGEVAALPVSRDGEWIGAPALQADIGRDGEADLDLLTRLALTAAREAVADSGLERQGVALDRNRLGCVIGTSKGGLRSFARAVVLQRLEGEFPARLWQQFLPETPSSEVARRFDLRGPALCPVAACATGLVSCLRGAELIRDGYCDLVLAGSADASLHAGVLGSFRRLGVLARDSGDPAAACRPFDRGRTGFAVGEGAAVLVLERLEHALARRATPYAEWLGGGMLCDAAGLTQLETGAAGLTRLIADLLSRAGLVPEDLDYVNLHGTATRRNDVCETRALKQSLGPAARQIRMSGLKGAIGHLLGAAGSVELAATVLALRDQVVPPTVNLDRPDAACDLDYTPGASRPHEIRHALKLSLGFGGHLAAALLRRWEDTASRGR